MLDKKFWLDVGKRVVTRYRSWIFDDAGGGKNAKDVYGNPFPPYKRPYSTRKATGKLKRQASKHRDSTSPVLTGDLMRDFKLRKTTEEGFTFGTTSHGSKVKSLDRNNRTISDAEKPIPDDIRDFLMEEATKYVNKKRLLPRKKTPKINIGL